MHKLGIAIVATGLLILMSLCFATYAQDLGQALIEAATRGDLAQTKALLDKGADVNAKDRDGGTVLMKAAWRGNLEVVKYLIDKGADVNAKGRHVETVLMQAARGGNLEVVKYLIDKGADVNAKDRRGRTVVLEAAWGSNLEVAKFLIDKGLDVNAKDRHGRTVLMEAAKKGNLELVKYLIDKGLDANAKTDSGNTVLMEAASSSTERNLEVVKFLIDKGLDVNAKDEKSRTALNLAYKWGSNQIVKLLKAHGGKVGSPRNAFLSNEQIESWWKPGNREQPDEDLEIHDVKPLRLKSGEIAFVASVGFPARGRCCNWGILLLRPDLQEARQTDSLAHVEEVKDLDRDGVDEVVTKGGFMAHGEMGGGYSVIQFDGWEPIILHSQGFADNFGSGCGKSENRRPCYFRHVSWNLDLHHGVDLVETIIDADGDELNQPDRLVWTTQVNLYLFKDKKFVLVPPDRVRSSVQTPKSQSRPKSR